MRLEKCWFCSSSIYPGHGIAFARNDGQGALSRHAVQRHGSSAAHAFERQDVQYVPSFEAITSQLKFIGDDGVSYVQAITADSIPKAATHTTSGVLPFRWATTGVGNLVFRFCRSKCHKNFKMKRNPRKVKWTKAYRKLAGKEMAEDTTFEMERRRNRPEKYNRELVAKTLTAIKKIDKIRARRSERFYEARMLKAKAGQRAQARKELEEQVHLVRAPDSLLKDAAKEKVKGGKIKVAVEQAAAAAMSEDDMDMSD